MAHLGFLTSIRNCILNLFICLAKHFSAPFLVSSLPTLCYVCVYPTPHPQFSAPFPLQVNTPCFPWVSPCLHCIPARYLLLQPCLHSWSAGQTCCFQQLLAWSRAGPEAAGRDCAERGFVPWPLHSKHSCVFRVTCTGWPVWEAISISLEI